MLAELQNCCDYLYVIDRGKLVNQGETTRLFNHSISRYKIKGNGVEQVKNKLFKIIFAEKISQVMDSIPWVCCASGNISF